MARSQQTEFIDLFDEFYRDYYRNEIGELAQKYPDGQKSLFVDWEDLYRFDPDLAEDYRNKPNLLREYAEEALRLFDLPIDVKFSQAHVRIQGIPSSVEVDDIQTDHRGQLISVPGTIRSVSSSISFPTDAAFECQRCGTLTRIPQSFTTGDLSLNEPHECQGCERNGPFRLNQDQSEMVDHQLLRLESFFTNASKESPASIVLLARDDLVDEVQPGDTVEVNGIINLIDPTEDEQLDATIVDKYLEVSSFTEVAVEDLIPISEEEKKEIIALSEADDIYNKFLNSIAPHTVGLEDIKLSAVLQLFGGVDKVLPDDTTISGTIHIGVIGDPGTFVSEIVKYAARISPKSIRTDGTDTTQAGLTTAAYPSSTGPKNWELDAGALVLADGGLASLTRVGELSSEATSGLESVMREQEVKASKGTATQVLPANTSVLASARPKYGRFDEYEPVGEQVDLKPDVIAQFDLLFTQTDQPDRNADADVAERVLQTSYAGEVQAQRQNASDADYSEKELNEITDEIVPDIDPTFAQKYIAYARRSCYPTLSDDAKETIHDFYVRVRSKGSGEDAPIPVTGRKLEAIVKLAEASARVRLSDTVEEQDAERVIELVRSSLENIGVAPETGEGEASVVERGTSEEQRERIKTIRDIIVDLEEEYDEGAPVDVVIERAEEHGMDASTAEHEIDKLKQQGEVYEPRTDHLRGT